MKSILKSLLLGLILSTTAQSAVTLDYNIIFSSYGGTHDYINMTSTVSKVGNNTVLTLSNNSVNGLVWIQTNMPYPDNFIQVNVAPVVTSIFFHDPNSTLSITPTFSGDGSNYNWLQGGILPVGNKIGFTSNWYATPPVPTVSNGVDPGEYITLTFANVDYDIVEQGLLNGTLRVGVRVQQLPWDDTNHNAASYVSTVVPEPSVVALGALGVMLLLRRKRH